MDTLTAISTRKSVKKYIYKPMSDCDLEKIIKAGLEAPSAMNLRPYEMYVITNREILVSLSKVQPAKKMLENASSAILILGLREVNHEECYLHQDCSAVTQNILLASHALNYGACWLGIRTDGEVHQVIAKMFSLTDKLLPVSLIAVGYPDGEFKPKEGRYPSNQVKIFK